MKNMQERKNELQCAIAKIIKSHRKKSITKSADEIGMGKSIWADLENGIKDPQMSTFWRISEAFDIKPHVILEEIEKELGNNFSFLENTSSKNHSNKNS